MCNVPSRHWYLETEKKARLKKSKCQVQICQFHCSEETQTGVYHAAGVLINRRLMACLSESNPPPGQLISWVSHTVSPILVPGVKWRMKPQGSTLTTERNGGPGLLCTYMPTLKYRLTTRMGKWFSTPATIHQWRGSHSSHTILHVHAVTAITRRF